MIIHRHSQPPSLSAAARRWRGAVLLAAAALALGAVRADPVTPQERARIAAAIPDRAPAVPARPRHLLVYTQTKGYHHASIDCGVVAFQLMGQRTGAYRVTVSDRPDVFTPKSLRRFDGVLFLSTTGEIFDRTSMRRALLDYVRGGHGIIGIHAATDGNYDWPAWGEMMGGFFNGHPWGSKSHVYLRIEDPHNPIDAAFKGRTTFPIQDEIYQLKAPYSRKTHRVLITLETRLTDTTSPRIASKIKRTDGDFAISQIRTYGKGRVFYCALGHNKAIFWNPTILRHYLAGIQWALGDLQADATPRPKPPPPPLVDDPDFLRVLGAYDYGTSRQPLHLLDRMIAEAGKDPVKLAVVEHRLVRVLAMPATTFAAKQAVCQRLGSVIPADPSAADPALDVLTPYLYDAKLLPLARLALDRVPGAAIDNLFLKAVDSSAGALRMELVQSLGYRRMVRAVPKLAAFAAGRDRALRAEALTALGEIGNARALRALDDLADPDAPAVVAAKLDCLPRLEPTAALKLCRRLAGDPKVPANLRAAAFRGLLEREPARAAGRIVEAIGGPDVYRRQVALGMIATLPDHHLVPMLTARLGRWDAATQAAVVTDLGLRGDAAAVPAIVRAAAEKAPKVRAAAITALGKLRGNPEIARLLAGIAAGPDRDEARLALQSLARLDGPGVTQTVLAGAQKGKPALRKVYLQETGLRHLTEAVPMLLTMRSDPDATLRATALGSLAQLAPAYRQPPILLWAANATDSKEQARALRALVAVTLRNPDKIGRIRPIIYVAEEYRPAQALRVLPTLSRFGGAEGAECLRRLALGTNDDLAEAAATQLTRWPDDSAIQPLVAVCAGSKRPDIRRETLKAAVKWIDQDRSLPSPELAAAAGRLLAASRGTDEAATRKQLVFLLARGADASAEALARKLEQDPVLGREARDTLEVIRTNRAGPPALTASANEMTIKNIIDGNENTSWSAPATGVQWIRIDFGQSRRVRVIVLEEQGHMGNFPRHYEVFVGNELRRWTKPVAAGTGQRGFTTIKLPAGTHGRYVMIRDTEPKREHPWTVSEMYLD